jgi:O-antigen/teichoic acid export membrane protein
MMTPPAKSVSEPDQSAPPGGLGKIAARGGLVTLSGQAGNFVLQMVSLIVLSRLLTPSDFGTFAMVTAIVGLAEVLRDFGLSSAAVQAPTLSVGQRANLFWINLLIGCTLGVTVFFLAGPIAAFYGNPDLVAITQWLSLTFVFSGLGTQYEAGLVRGFRFGTLAWTDITALILALTVSITVAVSGGGTAALVIQAVLYSLLVAVLRISASRWLPTLPSRSEPMGSLLRYGANLMGTQVIGYASRNVDSVIVGAKFGSESLGIYNRGFQVLMAPLNQISAPMTKVALPVFSRLAADHGKFVDALAKTQCLLAYAIVVCFSVLFSTADSVVLLLFGDQWSAVPPVFRILAVAGVFQIFAYSSYWVFLAKGLMNWNLRYALFSRVIVIGAIVIGSFWGYLGVAVGYSVAMMICWPLVQWWIGLKVDLPQAKLFGIGGRALLVGCAGAAAGMFATSLLNGPGLLSLCVGAAATLLGIAVSGSVLPASRRDFGVVLGGLSLMRGRV